MSVTAESPADAPTLAADDLTISIDGVPALRGSLSCSGARVLWVGDAEALVGAVSALPLDPETGRGQARIEAGTLRLLGRDVTAGAHRQHTGVAPPLSMLPLPPEPVREWLCWGARVRGASRRTSRTLAAHAIERLQLGSIAQRRPHQLSLLERRAAAVALAIVHDPRVLVLADPLDGLPPEALAPMVECVGRATRGRASIVTTGGDPQLLTILARDATDLVFVRGGEFVAATSPRSLFDGRRHYLLEVGGDPQAFARALPETVRLEGGPRRFLATMPPDTSATTLLHAGRESGATVLSCLPLVG